MRHNKKISADLEKEILKRSSRGDSGPQIVAWLFADHGIKISRQSVTDLLRKTRVERGEVAKAVTREALSGHVTSDLDILKRSLERVERLERRLHRKANRLLDEQARATTAGAMGLLSESANDAAAIALKASAEVRAQVDTKLEFAGAKEDVTIVTATPAEARKLIQARFGNVGPLGSNGSDSGNPDAEGDAPRE